MIEDAGLHEMTTPSRAERATPPETRSRRRSSGATGTLFGLALAAIALPGVAQSPGGAPAPDGERLAERITLHVQGAARPAWSRQGDWIAYDRRESDGYSDVHVARPDNTFDRCLTCEITEFRNRHAGNVDWHPSGEYLVFQSERPFKYEGSPYAFLAIPGRNLDSAVWVVAVEGRTQWQLTGHQEQAYPAHAPRFSFEGDRLAWSERVASSGTWGDWVLRVGEFAAPRGVARVRGVRGFEPAAQRAFYEAGSFTPDDRGLLFAGNLVEGQPIDGMDLYTLRLDAEGKSAADAVRQLTKDLTHWDRFPALAPDGSVVVWSSSQTLRRPPRPLSRDDRLAVVPMDLWIGAVDGSWARRLTGFNDALSEEYSGPVMVGPSAWSPAGDRLLTTVTPVDDPEHSDLFLIVLSRSFGPESPLLR